MHIRILFFSWYKLQISFAEPIELQIVQKYFHKIAKLFKLTILHFYIESGSFTVNDSDNAIKQHSNFPHMKYKLYNMGHDKNV